MVTFCNEYDYHHWIYCFCVKFVCLFILWDGVTNLRKKQSPERYTSVERKLVPTGILYQSPVCIVRNYTQFKNFILQCVTPDVISYNSVFQVRSEKWLLFLFMCGGPPQTPGFAVCLKKPGPIRLKLEHIFLCFT